ncbi:MAG: hypothetical protein KDG52_10975 [Rhodocyclaceae bacterium]|nr:hypothetical protein [Rhodocyclaceae bacterium]
MFDIRIHNQDFSVRARIDDSPIGRRIVDALPFHAHARVWGHEIYFGTSLEIDLPADASADVEVGALAYWPPGHAFCIFFGPTPESDGDRPRAAGPVAVFGHLLDDHRPLGFVKDGDLLEVERM